MIIEIKAYASPVPYGIEKAKATKRDFMNVLCSPKMNICPVIKAFNLPILSVKTD